MFVVFLPVLLLFVTFVIDVGNWFEHKRHLQLQADAAALAGAVNSAVPLQRPRDRGRGAQLRRRVASTPGAQWNDADRRHPSGNVHALLNSDDLGSAAGNGPHAGAAPAARAIST